MGHMNVQFYVAKADEGLAALAAALGLSPRVQRDADAMLTARDLHIRFHREMRPGAAFAVIAGVLEARAEGLIVYEEMRSTISSDVVATFVTRAEWCDAETRGGLPLPVIAIAKSADHLLTLPDHARPRGLDLAPARPTPHLDDAERMGLITTFRGAVLSEHCDRKGFMTPRHHIGRVSDAIPNLIALTRGHDRSNGTIGGAALEYRLVLRMPAREGDLMIVKSGLKSVGAKTYVWAHWLFDAESGDCFATAEAVAVAMDLSTRKAIDIPPDMRVHLERLIVPDLSV